jgi:hypothetical protein
MPTTAAKDDKPQLIGPTAKVSSKPKKVVKKKAPRKVARGKASKKQK